jgi:hypothetical protein
MTDITDLQETTPNHWKAKYHGNYGTYTVKIETAGNTLSKFSCSCPSDYYPCKHIPMVMDAIKERIKESKSQPKGSVFEQAIRGMSLSELQEFVIRFGQHNPSFQQAVLLKFAPKQKQAKSNQYAEIIRSALSGIDTDDMYDYHDDWFEIEVLDQWLDKAREHITQNNYAEAILIAKACLEEYAAWANGDENVLDYAGENYLYEPFNILDEAYQMGHITADELMGYCKKESAKNQYNARFKQQFDELVMHITKDINPTGYLDMQDKLFKALDDKSSYEAQQILNRKIAFYEERGVVSSAWKIKEENLQIEDFRKDVVQKLITEQQYAKAKKLIIERINDKAPNDYFHAYNPCWDEYLLDIARKEQNTQDMRRISRRLIGVNFHLPHYRTHKSTFSKEEWGTACEKLIKHYQKSNWFTSNVADVYVEEQQFKNLLQYLASHLHISQLATYHKHIAPTYPKETLELFKAAIDHHMNKTGRDVYEATVEYFKSMLKIEGGSVIVKQMMDGYRVQYRNRRAMIEIFEKFSKLAKL